MTDGPWITATTDLSPVADFFAVPPPAARLEALEFFALLVRALVFAAPRDRPVAALFAATVFAACASFDLLTVGVPAERLIVRSGFDIAILNDAAGGRRGG